MTGGRVLALNTSAALAGRLASIALGVLLATVLFRALGAEQYGIWSLLTLITGYSTLIDFGLSSAVERRVAFLIASKSPAGVAPTLGTALLLVLALMAGAQLLVMLVASTTIVATLGEDVRRALLLVPICTAVSLSSLAAGAVLAGEQRLPLLNVWRTLGMAAGTLGVVTAVQYGTRSLATLLLLYTAGSAITLALVWSSARGRTPGWWPGSWWERDAAVDLLTYGGVVQGATMVPPIAEYLFRLVIGARFGLEYAAVYDLAARAAIVPRSLAGALFIAMVPFAVQLDRLEGRAGIARLLRATVRHVALFILPVTAVLLALAGPLIGLWLGAASDPDTVRRVQRLFALLLLAHAAGALAVPAAMIARALRRPHAEALATTVSFAAALIAAQVVTSFELAATLLWTLPAAGGFAVWFWLARAPEPH